MGAGASTDNSPRASAGAVPGRGKMNTKYQATGSGAVAAAYAANPFDDSPFKADSKGHSNTSNKNSGIANAPVMSEAKLKKMALGLPGYKDVQRDYDETLQDMGKFNTTKTDDWSSPIGNNSGGAVKKETLSDGYPYGKKSQISAAVEQSVDPRSIQRQRQQNAVQSGVPMSSPAGPIRKNQPPPPRRPSEKGGGAPLRPHGVGGNGGKAAAAGGGINGDPRNLEISAPTFLNAPTAALQGTPPLMSQTAQMMPDSVRQNQQQRDEGGLLAGADAIMNKHSTPTRQKRGDPAAAAAAALAKAENRAIITPPRATATSSSNTTATSPAPAAAASKAAAVQQSKVHNQARKKDEGSSDEEDEDDEEGEGGIYEWTAFDTSADYKGAPQQQQTAQYATDTSQQSTGGLKPRTPNGPNTGPPTTTPPPKLKAPSQPPPGHGHGHGQSQGQMTSQSSAGKGLPVRPFPKDDDVEDMYATFGPRDEPISPKKPTLVPMLNILSTGTSQSSETSDGKGSTAQSFNSMSSATMGTQGGGASSKTGTAPPKGIVPPPPTSSPMKAGQSPQPSSQRPQPARGGPPKISKNPHEVKETTEVNRNKAQLPQALTHAKPTTGDWLKKRYIVNNYILLDMLGSGSYGEVRLCKERTTDHLYAVKIFSKDMLRKKKGGSTETYFEDVKREIAVMKKLLHPNVLRLFEVLDDPNVNKMYLILEYMKKGDLINILEKNSGADAGGTEKVSGFTPLSDLELWNIFRQVAAGIRYLHFQNIVHGDIKPQNLLVGEDGVVKIADFGIAKMLHASGQKLVDSSGTPAFMSPELFESGGSFSGQLADIWAIGATMFMLRFGAPPFVAKNVVTLSNKIQNDPLVFPGPLEDKLRDLLENMLVKNPSQRFTLQQVIMHPWMRVQPAPAPIQLRPQSLGGGKSDGNGTDKDNKGRTPPATPGKGRNFAPPSYYESAEAEAMKLAPISTDKDDIYMSIGFNKSKNKTATVAGDGPIAEEVGLGDADGENENGDLMATKWGADLFEMVEDDLDSDDDDDSMSHSAGNAVTATKNKPVEHLSTATSAGGTDNEHPEMPAEEEELRANRFKKSSIKQRRSHESMDAGSVTADNTDAQASSSSLHSKMEKGRAMKKDKDEEEDEEEEGLEASTTNLTMSEFGAMMDTLALQPRSKNMSAAVPLSLEIKPESFSVQLRNFKNGVGAAFHSEQGQRADQEDRCVLLPDVSAMRALIGNEKVTDATREVLAKFSIAAVFDGHSGWQCSQYLSQHLIPAMALHPKFLENKIEPAILDTFRNMDAKINNILRKEECTAGSTGIVAVYDGRKHVLTVANVGDSMCVLSRSGRAVKLHRVHRVFDSPEYEEERKRIEATGSRIVNNRVDGVLAISRAFGDIALKGNPKTPGPVIAVPDVVAEVITPMTEFGIIASDGLWDVMEPQLSVNFVRKLLNKKNDLQEAAAELAREALARGSLDNVTILILSFHMPPVKEEEK